MELATNIFEQTQPKFLMEKEGAESTRMSNTPMGDYQYDNPLHPLSSDCSSSDFSDEIQLNTLCDKNEKLFSSLTAQLQEINEEVGTMIRRLDDTEEEILTRRDCYRDIERLNLEYAKQIGREVEQVEKMEFLTDHLQKSMICRDEILENMKVVENWQLFDHFKRKENTSDMNCCQESEMFTSVESQ